MKKGGLITLTITFAICASALKLQGFDGRGWRLEIDETVAFALVGVRLGRNDAFLCMIRFDWTSHVATATQ